MSAGLFVLLRAIAILIRVSLDKNGQAGVLCVISKHTSHLGGVMDGIEDDVLVSHSARLYLKSAC